MARTRWPTCRSNSSCALGQLHPMQMSLRKPQRRSPNSRPKRAMTFELWAQLEPVINLSRRKAAPSEGTGEQATVHEDILSRDETSVRAAQESTHRTELFSIAKSLCWNCHAARLGQLFEILT